MAAGDSMQNNEPATPDRKIRRALYLVKDRLTVAHQDRLRSLIDTAPEPVIGREPSAEEQEASSRFKHRAKDFLNNLPPETGITYEEAMDEVHKEEKAKKKKKKTPPNSPNPVKPRIISE